MFVLPSDDYDCLLGLNWFLEMKVSISPAERTLKFENETYSLKDSDFLYKPETVERVLIKNVNALESEDIDSDIDYNSKSFSNIIPESTVQNIVVKVSELVKKGFARASNEPHNSPL